MAEAIKSRFAVDPEMIEGAGGIFDVKVDGALIYSKHETGEFPEHQLVLDKVGELSGAA